MEGFIMDSATQQAGKKIIDNLDRLAKKAVDRQYSLQSDTWKPYKQAGYEKSLRDSGYHFSYLAESLTANDPALFLDYVAWVKVLFSNLKFHLSVLTTCLNCMDLAVKEMLEPEVASEVHNYIILAQEHLSNAPVSLASLILPESSQFKLANDYLNALLMGDRHLGSQLILDAVGQGTSIKDIYLEVFQPCQLEIGRMWQTNQVSVAQEHFSTAATQMIMSQLYPYIFATKKNNHSMVATSVSGELHEIGMRMVTDFLEMEGWDTYYLGANTPTESILRAIKDRNAKIIAISATIPFHVSKVTELVTQIRAYTFGSPVKIMVGGYPFNISHGLWQQVGADGYARNAQDAIAVAEELSQGA
jgi:methanogenic corrinoid protein MtbC1